MIQLPPVEVLFLWPLIVHLMLLFLIWFFYDLRKRGVEKKRVEGKIYRCSACNLVYVDNHDLPGTDCPRCGHYNEAVRR